MIDNIFHDPEFEAKSDEEKEKEIDEIRKETQKRIGGFVTQYINKRYYKKHETLYKENNSETKKIRRKREKERGYLPKNNPRQREIINWTHEMIEMLIQQYKAGRTYREIANNLSLLSKTAISRSAVGGKISRIGIKR